jgi:hypothetical protein
MINTEALESADVRPSLETGRRVLLVDTDPVKRKLRLASMTQMGIDVCIATDAAQARLLVRESPYDLVLINLPRDRQGAVKLGNDMKDERPEQSVCFYVGQPGYLAANPLPESESLSGRRTDPKKDLNSLITRTCDRMPGRGRLLEAAWRMCFLRRGRSGSPKPVNGDAAKDSFGDAVRLAERAGLDG